MTGKAIIQFATVSGGRVYVSAVSYGEGLRTNKLKTTTDLSKAARFTVARAVEIAKEYPSYAPSVATVAGEIMPVETAAVREANEASRAAYMQLQVELSKAFRGVRL